MKRVCAVLGLALLMGCANNSDNNDNCPRKDKSCGKRITSTEAPVVQEVAAAEETPSN